jgi:ankyrin repeat protein
VSRIEIPHLTSLNPRAIAKQMKDGFTWACEYGRTDVVEFLLEHGVDASEVLPRPHKQTGLHWAAFGGHLGTVKALLKRRPSWTCVTRRSMERRLAGHCTDGGNVEIGPPSRRPTMRSLRCWSPPERLSMKSGFAQTMRAPTRACSQRSRARD